MGAWWSTTPPAPPLPHTQMVVSPSQDCVVDKRWWQGDTWHVASFGAERLCEPPHPVPSGPHHISALTSSAADPAQSPPCWMAGKPRWTVLQGEKKTSCGCTAVPVLRAQGHHILPVLKAQGHHIPPVPRAQGHHIPPVPTHRGHRGTGRGRSAGGGRWAPSAAPSTLLPPPPAKGETHFGTTTGPPPRQGDFGDAPGTCAHSPHC